MNTSGEAARRLVRRRVEISIAASPFGGISIPQTKTTQQVGNKIMSSFMLAMFCILPLCF